ncbi:MAG: TIGR04222 domain-containing membrane protein [Pseudonocardiaceae bacterium]
MSPLAASNVTWGITGPDFLLGYGVLALVVLLRIMVARWRLAAGPAGTATGELSGRPHDIAYLNGGPELAVLSALSSMRVAGTVVAEGPGRLRAAEPLDPDADHLERAVHLAAAVPISRRELLTNQIVRTALEKPRQRLEAAGLLLGARQQRRIKRTGLWMVAVGGLGLLRLLAGAANGAAVGYLTLELLAVGIVAAILLNRAPERSRRGAAELKRLRVEHNELAPGMRPDWTTYGPALAGLGVGIFGAGALWASDPAFAADVEAQRVTAGTGGFS